MRSAARLLVILFAFDAACSSEAPTTLPDIEATPVSASFQVQIDPIAATAKRSTLEPIAGPISIGSDPNASLVLTAAVKPMSQRAGILWVDLYFENKTANALRDVTVDVTSFLPSALYDFTVDPFADATAARKLDIGRIAKDGIARLAIGLPNDGSTLSFTLDVSAVTTGRTATSSAPLAMEPGGREAWVAVPDLDRVAVVDTSTDTKIAEVPIPGRPMSVAITLDGAFVLVTSARGNTVSVIDRATRQVVQVFDEGDGIGREPRHVAIASDGGRAFVSAYVGDTVTALVRNGDRFRVEGSVAVGRRPTGLSIAPDGKTVVVSHFLPRGPIQSNQGWVSVVGVEPLAVVKDVGIQDAFNLDKASCFADTIPVSPQRVTAEAVSTQLAGFFMNPAGTEGWVPGTRIAPAAIVERGPKADPALSANTQPRGGEISAPSTFVFDTRSPRNTDRLLSPGAIERPGLQDYIRCERFQLEIEMEDRELLPASEQVNRFAAFPTFVNGLTGMGSTRFVAFTRGGRRALLVSFGSDEIALFDAVTHSPATQRHLPLNGSNPTGIVLTPDGRKGYVSYENSLKVSVLDLSAYADPAALPKPSIVPYDYRDITLLPIAPNGVSAFDLVRHLDGVPERPSIKETTQIIVGDTDPMDPVMRRGKILFSSANPDKYPTLSKSSLGACISCHPDGGNDGSMWVTMEGERRTMSLRGGIAGRGWLHASATHSDAYEFVTTILPERFGGNLSADDYAALAQYVARGVPLLQAPPVDAAAAARGQALFAKSCASCHEGDKLTSGGFDPANAWGGGAATGPDLYDVGTATTDAHVALGTYFESILPQKDGELLRGLRGDRDLGPTDPIQALLDFRARPERKRGALKAPSLVNCWDNVLFFHSGAFDSLADAVHYMSQNQARGLTADDEKDLVEYIRTL